MTRTAAAQVFGEDAIVLLHQLAACASPPSVAAGGVLSLTITVPPETGGALRRAVLRAEAVLLRREADEVADGPLRPRSCHSRQASAVQMVARAVAERARLEGLRGQTVAERALLGGTLTASPP